MTTRRFPFEEWPRLVAARRRELAPPEHYVRAFDWHAASRVVDLGAGPGFFTPALLDAIAPAGTLTVVDVEPRMLEILRWRVLEATRLTTAISPLEALPFADGSFDTAWCAFVLHELEPAARDRALEEARRVVAPGGRLIVLEWQPIATDHGPPLEERVAAELLAEAMRRAGFSVGAPAAITAAQYALIAR